MARWSVSNIFRPVSRDQFVFLTDRFTRTLVAATGHACKLDLRLLDAPKAVMSVKIQGLAPIIDDYNQQRIFDQLDSTRALTKAAWDKAAYVECVVTPDNDPQTARMAYASITAKGVRPNTATFTTRPGAPDIQGDFLDTIGPRLRVGDGSKTHGVPAVMLLINRPYNKSSHSLEAA